MGTNAKLLIELDGTNASGFDGITIEASNVEVQGLVINDFASGISIRNEASNAKIEGNFIGTNPSGTGDQGNTFNGVEILFGGSDNVVIGGAPRTAHNLISGNQAVHNKCLHFQRWHHHLMKDQRGGDIRL